jgi:hypothetical protein
VSTTVPDPAAARPDDALLPVELAAQAVATMEALEAERLRIREDLAARIAAPEL